MRGLAAGILVSAVCSAPTLAQERDRSLERISLALQQPSPIVADVAPVESMPPTFRIFTLALTTSDETPIESAAPKKLGFTLVLPTKPGQIIAVSVPIGALVTGAFRRVAAAHYRRQEAAARRKVEAELKRFAEQ